MAEPASIYEILSNIQAELKVPKESYNPFGKYKYRNAEQILAELNPICRKYGTVLTFRDTVQKFESRWYLVSEAILTKFNGNDKISASGYAREADDKKGADQAQITGMATSYARKYALGALFAIDDGKDFDSQEPAEPARKTEIPANRETPAEDDREALEASQRRLWGAIVGYCQAYGGDPKKVYTDVFKRSDFQESPTWFHALAAAYEGELK